MVENNSFTYHNLVQRDIMNEGSWAGEDICGEDCRDIFKDCLFVSFEKYIHFVIYSVTIYFGGLDINTWGNVPILRSLAIKKYVH